MARTSFLTTSLLLALSASAHSQPTSLLIKPDAAVLPLDDIGLYTIGYQYRNQPAKPFPAGWSGDFNAENGIALKPAGEQNGKKAFLMHPPWRNGTGRTFQEFRVQLPPIGKLQKILVRGATAMRADALARAGEAPKSDGVTFRLSVNGRTLLDEHRADAQWKPFEFDLTEFAGKTVTLHFETDCGPDNNPSFDFAIWGNRQLVLQGFKPALDSRPAPPALDLKRLYPVVNNNAAPPSGFQGVMTILHTANGGNLIYNGADGTLQYQWTRPRTATDPPLGTWNLKATARGAKTAESVPLAGDAQLQWVGNAAFQKCEAVQVPGGLGFVSTYNVDGKTVHLRSIAKLRGKSLELSVTCDQPKLASLEAGHWGPVLRRRAVTAPYYSGQVFYLDKENLFVNSFLDWTASSASFQNGTAAGYKERTDGTRVPLSERVIFTAAWHALEAMPNVPNPPSPYIAHLGNKIVLDIWSNNFENITKNLEMLHDNGITNCAAIIHVWQHQGYDNGLPGHVPANEGMGGDAGMKKLVSTAKRLGYDIALHENYADYYPNYEKFDPNDIALRSDGERETAWFNHGTNIQSFAVSPTAMLRLAKEQSPQIRDLYGPNADYLDVHSATPPWFHQDYRAGSPGAGTFRKVWDNTRAMWAFERQNYGGPVLGEGNNHWYWSGLLDGVEAQFGSGWSDGMSAPLAVDFDLLKIHPLQFNHGMGYYERWWKTPNWGALPPMEVMDQYRMQEVIYGHAGFLNTVTAGNLPLAWLEHNLMSPVTARYAAAKPVNIQYEVNGRWVDSTAAAKAATWNRTRVTYSNGLTVTANNIAAPLKVGETTLPKHGWMATGAGVTAYTALRQGVLADYAQTKDSTFANARRVQDWAQSGIHLVAPSVAEFKATEPRQFTLTYGWKVGETMPEGLRSFVHFVGARDDIVFQNDHPVAPLKAGETLSDGPYTVKLPDSLPDGDYGVRIGLLRPNGSRIALQGRDDGGSRIRLGTVHVKDAGKTITFEPEPSAPDGSAIYERRLNTAGKVLDFGAVRTDGSVLIQRENGEWVLRALPRVGDFTLQLSAARFGKPGTVRCVDGPAPTLQTQMQGDWWSLNLNGAREYRWK